MFAIRSPRRMDWRWLDGVCEHDAANARVLAFRDIGQDEWYFDYHFPKMKVVPGVFLIEAMSHAIGVAAALRSFAATGRYGSYVLASVRDARFYQFVAPGARIMIRAEAEPADEQILGRATCEVEGRKVAKAQIVLQRADTHADAPGPEGPDSPETLEYVASLLATGP